MGGLALRCGACHFCNGPCSWLRLKHMFFFAVNSQNCADETRIFGCVCIGVMNIIVLKMLHH
jgi:hypothetical protein